MTPDQKLTVIFGALHVVALAFGGMLFAMFLRSESVTPWQPPDDEDGGGGGGEPPPGDPRAPAGPPLDDAVPAPYRLRDHRDTGGHRPVRRREHQPKRVPNRRPAAR